MRLRSGLFARVLLAVIPLDAGGVRRMGGAISQAPFFIVVDRHRIDALRQIESCRTCHVATER